jgi:hypothetical protein
VFSELGALTGVHDEYETILSTESNLYSFFDGHHVEAADSAIIK